MKILEICIILIISTSFMTVFSYIVSNVFNRQFREPVLLKEVFNGLKLSTNSKLLSISAWIVHYIIGALFIVIYTFLWKTEVLNPTFITGVFLGFISGIVGAVGWRIMFHYGGIQNKKNDLGYYIQLVIAHVILGIFAVIIFTY